MAGFTDFIKNNSGTIDVATTAIGGLMGVIGSIQGGIAAKKQAAYQAAVLRNNKLIAERAADQAIAEGREKIQAKGLEVAQLIGRQRAALASGNIVVDQDSALELAVDAARTGALDQISLEVNAEREALALRMQGANFEAKAQAAEAAGRDSARAGLIQGLGTLATTASTVASKWAVLSNKSETT